MNNIMLVGFQHPVGAFLISRSECTSRLPKSIQFVFDTFNESLFINHVFSLSSSLLTTLFRLLHLHLNITYLCHLQITQI